MMMNNGDHNITSNGDETAYRGEVRSLTLVPGRKPRSRCQQSWTCWLWTSGGRGESTDNLLMKSWVAENSFVRDCCCGSLRNIYLLSADCSYRQFYNSTTSWGTTPPPGKVTARLSTAKHYRSWCGEPAHRRRRVSLPPENTQETVCTQGWDNHQGLNKH